MTTVLMMIAGGLGAVGRSLVDTTIKRRRPDLLGWFRATFVVNVTGSFALGVLVGAASGADALLIVGTGFLGGYTTFSSAVVEAAEAARDRRYAEAAFLAVAMVLACVGAASLGLWSAR